jgi:hypothetical protein
MAAERSEEYDFSGGHGRGDEYMVTLCDWFGQFSFVLMCFP